MTSRNLVNFGMLVLCGALLWQPAAAEWIEPIDVNSNEVPGNGANFPSISADGRFVAFWSLSTNLVPGDTNGRGDVFVRDRLTGTTERVSVDSAEQEQTGGDWKPSLPPSAATGALWHS